MATFYSVMLTKEQYDILKSPFGTTQLVFQFFYSEESNNNEGSPKLLGYAMGPGSIPIDIEPQVLAYRPDKPKLSNIVSYVLGNQKVLIRDLRDLIRSVTGSPNGYFDFLLFTPKIDTETNSSFPHIYYEISIPLDDAVKIESEQEVYKTSASNQELESAQEADRAFLVQLSRVYKLPTNPCPPCSF